MLVTLFINGPLARLVKVIGLLATRRSWERKSSSVTAGASALGRSRCIGYDRQQGDLFEIVRIYHRARLPIER